MSVTSVFLAAVIPFVPGGELDLSVRSELTVECRVCGAKSDNPFLAVILEHGEPKDPLSFRVTFNESYRNRRVRGAWDGGKVDTGDFAIDDGAFHHVALVMKAGGKMTLYLDGVPCGEASAPRAFGRGKLHVGSRDGSVDSREDTFNRFRGYIEDVRISDVALTPGEFLPGTRPEDAKRPPLPPDADPPDAAWAHPETTRRYLQGPLSERLLTLWREGKVMYGEVCHDHEWKLEYADQRGHGVWLVQGEADEPFDFRQARSVTPPDGLPLHALRWHDGEVEVELSACAPFGRKPTAHARLTVVNRGPARCGRRYAFLLRSGFEKDLLFGVPDVYKPFAPDVVQWREAASTWSQEADGVCRDGDRFVAFRGDGISWDAAKGALRISADLGSGETRTVDLALGCGETVRPGYESACVRTRADWQGEFARMKLPAKVAADPERTRFARNLVTQVLQMMAVPTGDAREPILPRQGGMQRFVWPYENMPVMAALGLYGYGDYVEKVIALYFDCYQRENGNVWCAKYDWACITAVAIATLSRYCLETNNVRVWNRYRDAAFRSFDWVCRTRAESAGDPDLIAGLFPPMRSSDWEEKVQHWAGTDLYNLESLDWFVRAVERFGDGEAKRVRAECDDYRAVISRILDGFRSAQEGRDELRIPVLPTGDDERLLSTFYPALHYGLFAQLGFLSADEMYRVKRWLERRGMANGRGLYGFFPNFAGKPRSHRHHWYVSYGDYPWFQAWLRAGRGDLAEEILRAQLKWAMTDECYMGERYDETCPWYFPWSPNASANGRTLLMLSEL